MAHSLSAQKRVRQNAKRRVRNRIRKKVLRTELKKSTVLISGNNADGAAAGLGATYRVLDRAAAKGAVHRNTAARRKSQLARKINAMKAGGAAKASA